jgi:ribosomal-protein-alanine N-acetyltransferase
MAALNEADVDGPYGAWLSDPSLMRFIEAARSPPDRAEMISYVEAMNKSPNDLLLGIFTRDQNYHIGNIKLGSIDRYHNRGDIGLLIGERLYWNQGYASEAINAVADYAGRVLGLHRVFAGCHATNQGSVKAFLKAGFEVEGTLREHARDGDDLVDGIIVGRLLPS